jgi:hypothetical protein
MPASVHKILVHESDILCGTILPIGHLSEVAQESRSKDLRYFRRSQARKIISVINQRILISFWFRRIHLSRVRENCLKELPLPARGNLRRRGIRLRKFDEGCGADREGRSDVEAINEGDKLARNVYQREGHSG